MTRILTSFALVAVLLTGASAQQPAPKPPDPAEEASLHGYGDREKTCQEWTDGCRSCRRIGDGDPVCGNIGIACQPLPITCSRRTEPAK
jgi:hypothetical protein